MPTLVTSKAETRASLLCSLVMQPSSSTCEYTASNLLIPDPNTLLSWPGRGANSGLIGAFGLATTLYDILPTIRPGNSIPVERFMLQVGLLSTLQVREHEGRGGYIQGIDINRVFDDVFGAVYVPL